MPQPLTYVAPAAPAPKSTAGRAVVLIALAAAIAHLAFVQFNEAMPMRQEFGRKTPIAQSAHMIASLGNLAASRANGGNVQLHFVNSAPLDTSGSLLVTGSYYSLNYALYPARAFVGRDDRILNVDTDILAADVVPPPEQLRARGVTLLITATRDPAGQWAFKASPVR